MLFGLLAFFWPGLTLEILIILFAVFVFLNGGCAVMTAWGSRKAMETWWLILLEGIAGITLGILAFLWPRVTAYILLIFVAAWALITGIFEIFASVRLRQVMSHTWVLTLAGVLSVLLAFILLVSPAAGLLAAVWVIGLYAFLYAVLMFYMAFRIRQLIRLMGSGLDTSHD